MADKEAIARASSRLSVNSDLPSVEDYSDGKQDKKTTGGFNKHMSAQQPLNYMKTADELILHQES